MTSDHPIRPAAMKPPLTAAPVLCVRDVAAASAFYARAFGFDPVSYFTGNNEYAVLVRGAAQLHLFQSAGSRPNHRGGAHVADAFVWVDNLAAVVASATAAGLSAERGPEHYPSEPVATTEVVYPDPDDNWLCFAAAD